MEEYPTQKETRVKKSLPSWEELLKERRARAIMTPLQSKDQSPFWYVMTTEMLEWISEIEKQRGFLLGVKLPPSFLKILKARAMNHEAYYSSRIEGAMTSLEQALLSLQKNREKLPNQSLQMIHNNKKALQFMASFRAQTITHETLFALHEILMKETHQDEKITVGAYRQSPIYVVNSLGQVIYEGPAAKRVKNFMTAFLTWLNQDSDMHPLLKAAVAHFYFVHIHPFDDGNGRSARALSNLVLERLDYKFINILSPSSYFESNRQAYYRSIRSVEEHEHDMTFFILFYLKAIKTQMELLHAEIEKANKAKSIQKFLTTEPSLQLNPRQIKALNFLVQNSHPLSTKRYQKLNRCSDETARLDFNALLDLGLLKALGEGRGRQYVLAVKV